jgi:uncharacterized membrane protein YoaK (UPF0700 family)
VSQQSQSRWRQVLISQRLGLVGLLAMIAGYVDAYGYLTY